MYIIGTHRIIYLPIIPPPACVFRFVLRFVCVRVVVPRGHALCAVPLYLSYYRDVPHIPYIIIHRERVPAELPVCTAAVAVDVHDGDSQPLRPRSPFHFEPFITRSYQFGLSYVFGIIYDSVYM